MATTTNYGWTTPDDTGLVKDGASAIRSLGTSIDTTTKNLNPSTTLGDLEYRSSTSNTNTRIPIGTSGQGLQVVAGVPAWAASSTSTLTTTGDLLYASAANTLARRGIGTTGQVLTVSGGLPTWATPASGVTTFTRRLATSTANYFNAIAYNGTNLYVAVGQGGQLYSSADGLTWTSRTSGFGTNEIFDVAFGNGLFVATGQNGTITTSTDGTTWTARTSNMGANYINKVVYANSLWVAVGTNGGTTNTGGITYSSDGITWTRKSQSITVGDWYKSVIWNGTNWIVVADNSTNNYLYASAPSGTWTAGATGSATNEQGIWWDGTRHYTVTSSGAVRYSTSTTLGTTTALDATSPNIGMSANTTLYSPALGTLYSGAIYTGNKGYLSSITMDSTAYPNFSTPMISPTAALSSTSPFLVDGLSCVWYGAAGWIIGGKGRIWTSF